MKRNDTLFLENKIKRQIQLRGSEMTFIHKGEDKYHRPTEPEEISIQGIYHESTSYQKKNTDTGSTTHTKPSPMVLCSYADGSKLHTGDTLNWEESEYFITGIEDVQQLHAAIQVSLEEVLDE